MSLRYLILALVSQQPSTGYEIAQEFDTVSAFFWKATHQQIYRELGALADEGLLTFRAVAQQGKPDKKVYSVTPAGKKAFAAWYSEPPPPPRRSDALMIKFMAVELAGVGALRGQLAQARAGHEERLAALEAVEREHYAERVEDMPLWKRCLYLSLQHGIMRERAWLDWATMSAQVLKRV